MKSFSRYLTESAAHDISHWKHVGGQLGSNSGGVHEDESGNKHYVKFYNNHEQAKAEYATNRIYDHMGINVPKASLVKHGNKIGISTPWNDKLKFTHPAEDFNNTTPDQAHHIAKMYHGAVLTKNWDIIGGKIGNIHHDEKGNLHNIDQGGALNFRATGGHKDYGADIEEVHGLRNPNFLSGHLFNKVFKQHPDSESKSIESSVKNIDPNHIHSIFKDSGFTNHKELSDTFEKRRQLLINHYKNKG